MSTDPGDLSELASVGVIPVIAIDALEDAVPLARALAAGGLFVIEVTLRTPVALEAIRRIRGEVEGVVVGAGTVLSAGQIEESIAAGASFLVSPGLSPALAAAAAAAPVPFLPGVATVSEALAASERGFALLKFFPAEASGGIKALEAFAEPLPHLRFCPTGGVNAENAAAYLALPNVACVGGSWVAPKGAVAAGDFKRITALAAAASRLRPRP